MTNDILTACSDGIARITINRPHMRNATSGEMLRAMARFVQTAAENPVIRVLLIAGAGAHFMAGGDIKGFDEVLGRTPQERSADFQRRSDDAAPLWLALERIPKPVVVAVRGFAAGAAISLVAGADLVIASETAAFVLAHVGIGLVADAASTYHLPRAIGVRRAKQMAFLGDRISAAEALSIGLVNWVVPDAELEQRTEQVLSRLTAAPRVSIAQAKQLMNRSLRSTLEEQIAAEGAAVAACGASNDVVEGVSAFLQKRQPVFTGS
jgi:2-(1,2-epoxy-1,2-dihydrophenyl)acetyl-CoA isomerase